MVLVSAFIRLSEVKWLLVHSKENVHCGEGISWTTQNKKIKVDIINTGHNADEGPASSQLDSSLNFNKAIPELLLVSKEWSPHNLSTDSLTF